MISNSQTVVVPLVGYTCVLVPYRREHVPTYHEWMQRPDLLEATASEPLTLEQEYDMQQSWNDDPMKCTFIVLARSMCTLSNTHDERTTTARPTAKAAINTTPNTSTSDYNAIETADHSSFNTKSDLVVEDNELFIKRNVHAMIGDVNLFLSPIVKDIGVDIEHNSEKENELELPESLLSSSLIQLQAELNIMIADRAVRQSGYGREACQLMMHYGASQLGVRRFFCKVHEDNVASLALFESTTLQFQRCNYTACFGEIELEYIVDSPPTFDEVDMMTPKPTNRSLNASVLDRD